MFSVGKIPIESEFHNVFYKVKHTCLRVSRFVIQENGDTTSLVNKNIFFTSIVFIIRNPCFYMVPKIGRAKLRGRK